MWLITSDLHLSDRPKDASRFGIFRWLAKQQEKYSPEATFLLGDLTQDKDNHSSALVNRTIDELTLLRPPVFILTGNHDCVSADTEVLTKRGWLKYTDIRIEDSVIGLNINTGFGEWQNILSIIIKDTKQLYHMDGQDYDILCSEKHRVLTKYRKGSYHYNTPTEVPKHSHKIPLAVNVQTQGVHLEDDEIRLAAWILTDGSIDKNWGYVALYQSKEVKEIKKVIKSLGLNPRINERNRTGENFRQTMPHFEFRFNAKESTIIRERLDLTSQKTMPLWAWKMNKQQFEIFLTTVMLGDGTWYKNRTTKVGILYKSEHFLSSMQGLCHIHGYKATLTTDNRGDFRLNISQKIHSRGNNFAFKKVDAEAPTTVWCLSVPLGSFLVRRNGKAFLTGNCVDNNNPFFRFLNCIEGIHFIVEPEVVLGNVAMIPHCRTQEQFDAACKGMPHHPDALMQHQTIAGAIAETNRPLTGFSASPIELLKPLRCYSGDVHKPQQCGLITYVGAPYQIRFNDQFEPRVLLVNGTKEQNLYYPHPHKWTLRIRDASEITNNLKLKAGDQVKLIIELAREEMTEWSEHKRKVLEACKELGLEVFGVDVDVKSISRKTESGETSKQGKTKAGIVTEFCKNENVSSQIKQVGLDLVKN